MAFGFMAFPPHTESDPCRLVTLPNYAYHYNWIKCIIPVKQIKYPAAILQSC